jgi:hypothetical protein
MVAYCAAVLAVSTTCRSVELKNLPPFEQRWPWFDHGIYGSLSDRPLSFCNTTSELKFRAPRMISWQPLVVPTGYAAALLTRPPWIRDASKAGMDR